MILVYLSVSSLRRIVSKAKNQPKEEVFGTDIPRTSGGHSRRYRIRYPGPKLWSGRSKSWKTSISAQTSTTLSGFETLPSEKVWAEFSFPILSSVSLHSCPCVAFRSPHLLVPMRALIYRTPFATLHPIHTMGPKMITYTYFYYLRINFPITQDICYTGLSGRNYFV